MSKKESAARLSKREQLRAERRRRALVWNVILLGGGAALILGIAAYFLAIARPGPLPGELSAPRNFPDEGRGVVPSSSTEPLLYQHYPPSSGTHYSDQVAPWGVATTPVPEPVYLHNLKNGGVVFLYACAEACPELEQQFQQLYAKAPPAPTFRTKKILVSRYERDLPSPIVALAWNHQLNLSAFDEALMLRWYKRFVNLGPEGNRVP